MQNRAEYKTEHCLSLVPINWAEYQALFAQIPQSNLLQSPLYAQTARQIYNQTTTPYRIDIGEEHAVKSCGIAAFQEVSLFNKALHGVILDRGPLWLNPDMATPSNIAAFFQDIQHFYPPRLGRRRRILPELNDTNQHRQILEEAGLKRRETRQGYQTLWLDLTLMQDQLWDNLHGKWRNILRKSLKAEVQIEWSGRLDHAAIIIAKHNQDRKTRGYQGASLKTLSVLCHHAAAQNALLSGIARANGQAVGGVVILLHGKSATYQVGWNSDIGRERCVNYRLIWEALKELKTRQINTFDLGGVNDDEAAGVKRFKSGTGANPASLIGQYF